MSSLVLKVKYIQENLEHQSIIFLPRYNRVTQQIRRPVAVDEQLQNLIDEVCRHDRASPERQKALSRLLIVIQKLPEVYRSSHQDYPAALNQTLEWVSKNIDSFKPYTSSVQQSLITWINSYLKWRIRDLYVPDNQYESRRIYLQSQDEGDLTEPMEKFPDPESSLSLLDLRIAQLQEAQRQRQGQAVRQYIERDPGGELTQCHLRKHPQCHCQSLALRLLLQEPPQTIADISREFQINNQTLYSHWKQKCLPLLQEIGRRFGNQP